MNKRDNIRLKEPLLYKNIPLSHNHQTLTYKVNFHMLPSSRIKFLCLIMDSIVCNQWAGKNRRNY